MSHQCLMFHHRVNGFRLFSTTNCWCIPDCLSRIKVRDKYPDQSPGQVPGSESANLQGLPHQPQCAPVSGSRRPPIWIVEASLVLCVWPLRNPIVMGAGFEPADNFCCSTLELSAKSWEGFEPSTHRKIRHAYFYNSIQDVTTAVLWCFFEAHIRVAG